MIIKDAVKLSRHNKFELDDDAYHGCYHCIRVFKGSEITEFTDNDTTALCPHCGIDSILPEVTNTKLLANCCAVWFTGHVQDPEMDTLQKLKILEAEKCIYNIHYCNAGVGIVFYNCEKHVEAQDWRNGLNCQQYHPTFEKCIAAEYAALDITNTPAVPADDFYDNHEWYEEETITTTTTTLNEDVSGVVYEYEYVQTNCPMMLSIEVNHRVSEGWEVDGAFVGSDEPSYIQRMRREKVEE